MGGTWYENRYPGARVDSPSRIYTHIYGAQFSYPYPFCPQAENEKYFNWVADTFDVRSRHSVLHRGHLDRLGRRRSSCGRSPHNNPTARRSGGVNAVISAVGFLSRPNIPTLEGIDDFHGEWFHTARWPAGLDLTRKRVAVVGTGCTGYQLIPEIVNEAEQVYVFQTDAELGVRGAGLSRALPRPGQLARPQLPLPDKLRPVPGLVSQPAAKHLEGSPSRPGLPRRARRERHQQAGQGPTDGLSAVKARSPSRPFGQDDAEGAADVCSTGAG